LLLKVIICSVLLITAVLYYFYGLRKTLRILRNSLLSLLGLIILSAILINFTIVQNFLIGKLTKRLSASLHTRVKIRHVAFQFFDKMVVDSALIEDQNQDTLLYAGNLSVRITDFFFMKARPVLHYVGMDHVRLNLIRTATDSTWNYQFLLDALSTPGPADSTKSGMNPDLRKVELTDLVVNKKDGWQGEDMHLAMAAFHLDARSIDLKKKIIRVNHIGIDRPVFDIVENLTGHGSDSSGVVSLAAASPAQRPRGWNSANWQVFIKSCSIQQGRFSLNTSHSEPQEGHFDPSHILITNLAVLLTDTRTVNDTILTQLKLSARERSGFLVRKLSAHVKFSPVGVEFASLDLETNRSQLRNYYAMGFRQLSDMGDYLHQVRMQAKFLNCTLSSDDLAYFAPALSSWKKNILLRGNAAGTVSNLHISDLDIRAGNSTSLQGNIQIVGLPDIDHTFIDFAATEFHTSSRDLEKFIPSLKSFSSVNLDSLTNINFRGNFTGFTRDFVAYGSFHTNLGDLTSDLNLKMPGGSSPPSYSGKLSTNNLDLGVLLSQDYLGKATLAAKVDGQGLRLEDLRANLNANIDQIALNGYNYHNIKTNGEFEKKRFSGLLLAGDTNLALLFQGKIDFSDSLPVFNFNATVTHSNLLALHLTRDSMLFSGQLDMNFAGNNIDNFLGTARLYHINLYKNKHRVAFDSLYVNTSISGVTKTLTLHGNEIDGYIKGIYDLRDLPSAVQYFLNNYYPSLIKKPLHYVADENFSFSLNLGRVDSLLRTFTTTFFGFNQSQFTGDLDAKGFKLDIAASVPSGGVGKYRFDHIQLKGTGNQGVLGLQTTIGSIYSADSLLFPNTSIMTSSTRDSSYIELKTRATSTLNAANLAAKVITGENGYDISILNSQIVINDKTWKIPSNNEFFISKNGFRVHNFTITNNDQVITLSSGNAGAGDNTGKPTLVLQLKNLNINDFATLTKLPVRMEGVAGGTIQMKDPFGQIQVNGELHAEQFRFENDSLGKITITGGYDQGLLKLRPPSRILVTAFQWTARWV
jgi:hypothetical protein